MTYTMFVCLFFTATDQSLASV